MTIAVYAEHCFLIFCYGVVTIWKCFHLGFNDVSSIKHTNYISNISGENRINIVTAF